MTTYEKIQMLCRRKGFAISNLSEKVPGVKISRGAVSGWKKGAVPSAAVLKAIADYFGVSVDYLLGKTEVKAPAGKTDDEELAEYLEFLRTDPNYRMMFSLMKGATKRDVEKAVKIVKSLLGED